MFTTARHLSLLNQMNPVHTLLSYFFTIRFDIIVYASVFQMVSSLHLF